MTMNFLTGIVAIVIGGIYFLTAMLLPQMTMGDRLGPKLFPSIVGLLSIVAGAVLMLQERNPAKRSKKADFGFAQNKSVWFKILLTTAMGIAYGLLMDSLGFLLPTAFFMFFITTLINKGRVFQNLIIAILFSVICYGVFAVALKLSLPRGVIEQALPF